MRKALVLLLSGALLSSATPARAQEVAETIVPDRPGLGDGAHVVGAGVVQVEVGVEAAIGSGGDVFTFGQSLVRYGVGGIEIRIFPGSVLIADDERGAPDPGVGLKVPLSTGDGPLFSAVLSTTLPVGSAAFSAGEARGAPHLDFGRERLSDRGEQQPSVGVGDLRQGRDDRVVDRGALRERFDESGRRGPARGHRASPRCASTSTRRSAA